MAPTPPRTLPRILPRILWIAAILSAFAAILSFALRGPERIEPASEPSPPAQEPAPPAKPAKAQPSSELFVQQAHRDALDETLAKVESQMPALALWELLRVDASVRPPYQVLSKIHYTQAQKLEGWARELNEIDRQQLDPKRKIYHRSAQFLVARALNGKQDSDPLSSLRLTQRITDALLGAWLRREDPKAWLEPVRSLAQQWEHLSSPPLSKIQRKALKKETQTLVRRLQRWQSPKAQAFIPKAWRGVLKTLQQGLQNYLQNYQGRALAQRPAAPHSAFTTKQWDAWTRWELGHSPRPAQAATAIRQSAARLALLNQGLKVPKTRRGKSRPNLHICREARESLHEAVPTPGPWIEHKIDCQALMALSPPADHAALMHTLILHGWVDPTRLQVRRQQRPLMAGLASRWGASVHAQLRALMFLAQLPVQDWSQALQGSIVGALQGDLCRSFALLQQLDATSTGAAPPHCASMRSSALRHDEYAALRGIRVAAMPQTRARMAGLDRFYWAPPQLALYWATPKGQDPDSVQGPHPRAPAHSAKLERLQRTP